MLPSDAFVIMIAPNVSQQMGGEAMKAMQIFQELKKKHNNTLLITHARNRKELSDELKFQDVMYVEDDWVAIALWRSAVFSLFVNVWFSKKAIALAENYIAEKGIDRSKVILHQTEPNSPVSPRSISKDMIDVFGPINGNIYYPKIFRKNETLKAGWRRRLHSPFQMFNKYCFKGLRDADMILAAGGERTISSLLLGGASSDKITECIDCGIKDEMLDRPRITQTGENLKFIHFGRLVFHKGTHLIIKSLVKTKNNICLDIVGRGPELEHCQELVKDLKLEERVKFLGWYPTHEDLLNSLDAYRGVVLPSIEDANGIVVQESMALGLPAICLDWGGPQLLVQHGQTGYLVEPKSVDYITSRIAEHMDTLAMDGELAESMSVSSRQIAESWRWSNTMTEWMGHYNKLL